MRGPLLLRIQRWLLVSLVFIGALPAHAEILVIANVRSGVESLTKAQVMAVALGRNVQLPGGAMLQIVDQSTTQIIFHDFHRQVTGMSRVRLNAYWARQVFTGVARAPRRLENDAAVLAAVSADPELLGYVSALPEDMSSMRVVYRLESSRPASSAP